MTKNNRLFIASIIALMTMGFGFVVRGFILDDWQAQFNLSETQKGSIQGAGLYPQALAIVFFSLIVDKLGYGRIMAFAWCAHVASAVITITAHSYAALYWGTFIFALAAGTVEAVVNPVTATLFPRSKTHHLNMLHAGWPGGMVLGGMLAIAMAGIQGPGAWRWKIALFLVPTLIYGLMMLGQKFPVQERVAAGVSYTDMLKEFGWAGCLIICIFAAYAVDEIMRVFGAELNRPEMWAIALTPTVFFAIKIRSFGRPMFIFLLFVMILLATTELGTDSWISTLMTPVLRNSGANAGKWVLIYTSAIMFGLRFCAGPIVHRITPLGLLAAGAVVASCGLFWLSAAGSAPLIIFLAATCYGLGKSFFWPTTMGVVSEQFPKGGALTLSAMAGVGMIAVGVLGSPLLGTMQDVFLDRNLQKQNPALHAQVAGAEQSKYGMKFQPLVQAKVDGLPAGERSEVEAIHVANTQRTLAKVAVLPLIMFFCYLGLLFYFKGKGGYRQVELKGTQPAGESPKVYTGSL
jgi:MFS family permease